jgi:hypothetical protein
MVIVLESIIHVSLFGVIVPGLWKVPLASISNTCFFDCLSVDFVFSSLDNILTILLTPSVF